MKRIISLLLTLLFLLPLIASCGTKEEVVFTYEGHSITKSQYQYWVSDYKTEVLKHHGAKDTPAFWKTEIEDGVTMLEYYAPIIDGVVKNYCIARSLYRKYGLSISSEVRKAINDDINEKIELYGSRAEVNAALAPLGINIGGLKEIYLIMEEYNAVFDHLFGQNGIMAADADEVEAYYNENYHRMKYVVFETTEPVLDKNGKPTYDITGSPITTPCSKEEIERKKNLMEDLKTEAGLGTEATFDELIKEYSAFELDDYPNGLFVSANEATAYGTKIVKALGELKPGECTVIEETGFLFLIRKYTPIEFGKLDKNDIEQQLVNLEHYTAQKLSAELYADLQKDVTVNEAVKATVSLDAVAANTDKNF